MAKKKLRHKLFREILSQYSQIRENYIEIRDICSMGTRIEVDGAVLQPVAKNRRNHDNNTAVKMRKIEHSEYSEYIHRWKVKTMFGCCPMFEYYSNSIKSKIHDARDDDMVDRIKQFENLVCQFNGKKMKELICQFYFKKESNKYTQQIEKIELNIFKHKYSKQSDYCKTVYWLTNANPNASDNINNKNNNHNNSNINDNNNNGYYYYSTNTDNIVSVNQAQVTM